MADDPWIDVSDLNPRPVLGDHTTDEGITFAMNHTALSAAQGAKLGELRDKCADVIKNNGVAVGMHAGGAFVFPTKTNDQMNINAAFQAAIKETDPEFQSTLMCGVAPTTGYQNVSTATDWQWRDFDKEDTFQIAANLQTHVQRCREELWARTADVLAATTVTAIAAVVWTLDI